MKRLVLQKREVYNQLKEGEGIVCGMEIIMEKKDNDSFDYEEIADRETDSAPVERQNKEFSEYGETDDFDVDDFDEDRGFAFQFKPWMIPAFVGMMILAILICIPLWKLSHHDRNTGNQEIVAATAVPIQTSQPTPTVIQEPQPQTSQPASTVTQESQPQAPQSTPTVTQEPQPQAPQTTPTATPEAQPQPAETPVATELPGTGSTGDALAEGNSMTFGDVNENVTAKDVINLRSTPYTGDEANVVGQLKNGETLIRTGRNDSTGWSRLEYNGQTVYAVSAYLTTDLAYKTPAKPTYPNRVSTQDGRVIVFTDCDDYITPKELINLRTEPSTSEGESTVRIQVQNGTSLHRTGYSEGAGWSRVEYNGEVLYAVTNYVISGTAPEQ